MEFFSAIHCYASGNSNQIISELMTNELYEVVSYLCGLHGAEQGIVKDLTVAVNDTEVKNRGRFLETALVKLVGSDLDKSVKLSKWLQYICEYKLTSDDESLIEDAIQSIKLIGYCFFCPSQIDQLNLLQFCKMLEAHDIGESRITSLLENIQLTIGNIQDFHLLKYARHFESVQQIIVEGRMISEYEMSIIGNNMIFCEYVAFLNSTFVEGENVMNQMRL